MAASWPARPRCVHVYNLDCCNHSAIRSRMFEVAPGEMWFDPMSSAIRHPEHVTSSVCRDTVQARKALEQRSCSFHVEVFRDCSKYMGSGTWVIYLFRFAFPAYHPRKRSRRRNIRTMIVDSVLSTRLFDSFTSRGDAFEKPYPLTVNLISGDCILNIIVNSRHCQ